MLQVCCNEKSNLIKDPGPFYLFPLLYSVPPKASYPCNFTVTASDNLSNIHSYLFLAGVEREEVHLKPRKYSFSSI